MVKIIIEITEANGIAVELKSEKDKFATKQEEMFANQFGKTITDFLNSATKEEQSE